MKLSERIASGENTPELREAIAVLAGWTFYRSKNAWSHDACKWRTGRPEYMDYINLTLADIERRGWDWLKCLDERGHVMYAIYTDDISEVGRCIYAGNDARCACEAYVKALENDNG